MASVLITAEGVSALYVRRDYGDRDIAGGDSHWTLEHVEGPNYFLNIHAPVLDELVAEALENAAGIVVAHVVDKANPIR